MAQELHTDATFPVTCNTTGVVFATAFPGTRRWGETRCAGVILTYCFKDRRVEKRSKVTCSEGWQLQSNTRKRNQAVTLQSEDFKDVFEKEHLTPIWRFWSEAPDSSSHLIRTWSAMESNTPADAPKERRQQWHGPRTNLARQTWNQEYVNTRSINKCGSHIEQSSSGHHVLLQERINRARHQAVFKGFALAFFAPRLVVRRIRLAAKRDKI